MGRWYVVDHVSTFFDRDSSYNAYDFTFDSASATVDVTFKSISRGGQPSTNRQRALVDEGLNTRWTLTPRRGLCAAVGIPFLVAHCEEDYSGAIIGAPGRNYVWVIFRTSNPSASERKRLRNRCRALGYDMRDLRPVPHGGPSVGEEADFGDNMGGLIKPVPGDQSGVAEE